MSYILSLETSTKVSSVALHKDGALIGSQQLHIDKSHSGLLTVMIEDLLKYCGVAFEDLSAVAVSNGPGSYTGLRIGLSTAKGLCFGLDIPLITLNTLKVMAEQVKPLISEDELMCPMLDARRMEVYTLILDRQGNKLLPMQPKILDESSFADELRKGKIVFFGSGVNKCQGLIGSSVNAKIIIGIEPLASAMGELAYSKYGNKNFADLAYAEPVYLKEFGGRPLAKK